MKTLEDNLLSTPEQNQPDPTRLKMTAHTKSFRYLLRYAIPFTLAYVFLPALLEQMHFPLGGLLLSAFVIIFLNIAMIVIFKRLEHRRLEQMECSRMGMLVATFTLIVTSLLMIFSIDNISNGEVTLQTLMDNGMLPILVISGAIGFVINYAVVYYGMWWMQKMFKS